MAWIKSLKIFLGGGSASAHNHKTLPRNRCKLSSLIDYLTGLRSYIGRPIYYYVPLMYKSDQDRILKRQARRWNYNQQRDSINNGEPAPAKHNHGGIKLTLHQSVKDILVT